MKTVTQHIRDRLESCLKPPILKPDLDTLRQTQWSPEFETLMRNRLVMGAMRYEVFVDKKKAGYDYLSSVEHRLSEYKRTGNTEFLVDAANCILLEFVFGEHPNKHFHAIDDGVHVSKV